MIKADIKNKVAVIDRWYPEKGTGIIKNVKKTVFTVDWGYDNLQKFDYPHAQFLDKVKSNKNSKIMRKSRKNNELFKEKNGELCAILLDEEDDDIKCKFNSDDCVTIDTKKLSYIVLTRDNLIQMLELIDEAEDF